MGLLDILLRGHHGSYRHGGHHGDGGHHRPRYDYGWGQDGNAPGNCGHVPAPDTTSSPPASSAATIRCANCQTANGSGARFCQQCGTSLLPEKCAHCDASMPGGSKFCGQCGKAC